MEKKQRLFIYDRREAGVLVLLGVMVAVFAFTLGVHLGKKVGFKGAGHPDVAVSPLAAAPENTSLAPRSADAPRGLDETLKKSLHDEVVRTGIKLENPRQVDLPDQAHSANAGATTLSSGTQAERAENDGESPKRRESLHPSRRKSARRHGFALQVGSFSDLKEAKLRAAVLESLGVKPLIHSADIKGKGTWYRIYLGEFATRDEAERAGQKYRATRVIDSFIVAKAVD